jgi:hypothetical protein
MTATVTRGGPAAGSTAGPGKVRLTRAGLVLACLAWGALAALAMAASCAWGLSRRLAEYR